MRTKIYDHNYHRLLYFDREASTEFWDEKWEKSARLTFDQPPRHGKTVRITRRYLAPGSVVLEGGCGLGDVVHALDKAGYQAHGIDFAPEIVKAINRSWPHLKVREGDVRHLPWDDGYFDGYWSFGVIEHFLDGYDDIAREMYRVLKHGGFLFLSFPAFNRYRQRRAAAGRYRLLAEHGNDMAHFYQFALDPRAVQLTFEGLGFELMEHRGMSSLDGLADESRLAAAAQRLIERMHSRASTVVSQALDIMLGKQIGHSCLLVLKKI